jgi:hypothetical protein
LGRLRDGRGRVSKCRLRSDGASESSCMPIRTWKGMVLLLGATGTRNFHCSSCRFQLVSVRCVRKHDEFPDP